MLLQKRTSFIVFEVGDFKCSAIEILFSLLKVVTQIWSLCNDIYNLGTCQNMVSLKVTKTSLKKQRITNLSKLAVNAKKVDNLPVISA